MDLVVVTPRWATLEFAMPLEKWRGLLGDRVTLAGGWRRTIGPSPDIPVRHVTREEATGAAVAVLSGGADVVYLYNYFHATASAGRLRSISACCDRSPPWRNSGNCRDVMRLRFATSWFPARITALRCRPAGHNSRSHYRWAQRPWLIGKPRLRSRSRP